jgi:hypothetical protein
MIETPPRGGNFGGVRDAFGDPRGAWRCAQIRENQSQQPNSREQEHFQGISRLWRLRFCSEGSESELGRQIAGGDTRISPSPNREHSREGTGNDQGAEQAQRNEPSKWCGRLVRDRLSACVGLLSEQRTSRLIQIHGQKFCPLGARQG